jgi:hypothetical protein
MVASLVVWCIVTLVSLGIDLSEKDHLSVAVRIVAIAFILWMLKDAFDDDNWFNDQWKRLKRGFKNFRQRLARAAPLPSPI